MKILDDNHLHKDTKIFKYPVQRQQYRNKVRFVINIHINGDHAIRVIRPTEQAATQLATEICAYLKLKQVQYENRGNRK